MPSRYLELKDKKSDKFWEIKLKGSAITVRFGRRGADGQSKTKEYDDTKAARAEFDKQIQAKLKKGYVDKSGKGSGTAQPAGKKKTKERKLSNENAHSVYFFYKMAGGDRKKTIELMNDFRDDDDSPKEIAAAVKEFFADIKGYTAIAKKEEPKEEARRKAEERAQKIREREEREELIRKYLPKKDRLVEMAKAIPLNEEEILEVAEALLRGSELLKAVKRFAKPAQFHLFMWNYNFDDGFEVVKWITRSKNCDAGTALACAWRTDSVEEAFESKSARGDEVYKLVLDIHKRWVRGDYQSKIRFDPSDDGGHDWTCGRKPKDIPGMDPKFLGPSRGKAYKWPTL